MKEAVAIGLGVVGLLLVGGVAYAASSSSTPATGSGAAAGGSSGSAGASLPAGSTQGLTASHSTASGWQLDITLVPNTSGLQYYAFFGDVIRLSLPAGAHWRRVVGTGATPALSPPTGTDAFVFQFVEPMAYTLAYTDVTGVDQTTVIYLEFGGTFAKTTHLTTGDYVILAVTQSDFVGAFAALTSALSAPATGDAVLIQQAETMQTGSDAIRAATKGAAITAAEVLTLFFAMGPWQSAFGIDVRTFLPFPIGTPVPSWWPSDDTAAASEYHVLYRYIGPGIDVSALPFPVTAWRRVE